jgi:hypothetical protein
VKYFQCIGPFKTVTYHISTFVYFSICHQIFNNINIESWRVSIWMLFLKASFIMNSKWELLYNSSNNILPHIFFPSIYETNFWPCWCCLKFEVNKWILMGYHILPMSFIKSTLWNFKLSLFKVNSSCGK